MLDQPKRAGADERISPTFAEDIHDQAVVLIFVLALNPTHLTIPDLVREIASGSEDFAEGDRLERAIRDLTGTGLLCCSGGLVRPTRAALQFAEIINSAP